MASPFEQMQAPANWQIGVFEGPDTADFLQRLSTTHIRDLTPGSQAVPSTFLNAQGRIQAAFWLARSSDESFLIASADLKSVGDFIERYTFAEKQTFRILDAGRALWVWSETADSGLPLPLAQAKFHMTHGDGLWDAQWWSAWGINPLPGVHMLSEAEFTARRITRGIPWWGNEITSEASPLEIHFQSAIATQKGCYPGQEVIERTLSMGSPARRLCRVKLAPDSTLPDGWQITTPASTPAGASLALVRKTQAVVGNELDGASCLEVFDFKN